MTCGASTPPGCSGSTRCSSTRARRALGEGALRAGGRELLAVRASTAGAPVAGRAAAGRPDLRMLEVTESRSWRYLRAQLAGTPPRHLPARGRCRTANGVGPVAGLAMTCWLGGAGRFSSSRKAVRFAGLDVTVYSSDGKRSPGHARQGPPMLRWVAYEAGKTHARPGARPPLLRAVKDRLDGKIAALSEARKIIRPQACHMLAELGDDAFTAV